MERKIVVGYDGSDHAKDAVCLARRLVRATGSEMILANVYPGPPALDVGKTDTKGYFDTLRSDAERVLAWAEAGERAVTRAIPSSSAHRGLHDLAVETGASIIVIGSTHQGKLGLIEPGSTGERLLHGAPCAVAIAPSGYTAKAADRPGHVAVAYNGTDEARAALDAAIGMAHMLDVPLRAISIFEIVPDLTRLRGADGEAEFLAAMRNECRAHLDEALAAVPDDIQAEGILLEGDAADLLRAQDDVDMLVLGSAGFGRLKGAILGSVSARVVRGASAPAMIVPAGVDLSSTLDDGARAGAAA